ncbi:hypothetical protein [Pandoraea pnomenusa]
MRSRLPYSASPAPEHDTTTNTGARMGFLNAASSADRDGTIRHGYAAIAD